MENQDTGKLNNQEIKFLKELFETKIETVEKAIVLADENLKMRLENMNQIREQLVSQASTFATKFEVERDREDIKKLELVQANLAGKASQSSVQLAYILNVIAIIVAVLSFFLKK